MIPIPQNEFGKVNGNLKGVIVDEDGLDVLYWRKLEGEDDKQSYEKQVFSNFVRVEEKEEEKQMVRSEIPLLRGKSSTSQSSIWNDVPLSTENQARSAAIKSYGSNSSFKAIGQQNSSIQLGISLPPPPPPIQPKKAPPPPPMPKAAVAGSLASSSNSKPPPVPKGGIEAGNGDGQVKLKPLHWDKVNPSAVDHSMVWDKIEGGSFK